MLPHEGIGACTPKPKNESADSVRMAPPTPSVALTRTGTITLGRMWMNRSRRAGIPASLAAWMYSLSRMERTGRDSNLSGPALSGYGGGGSGDSHLFPGFGFYKEIGNCQ